MKSTAPLQPPNQVLGERTGYSHLLGRRPRFDRRSGLVFRQILPELLFPNQGQVHDLDLEDRLDKVKNLDQQGKMLSVGHIHQS